MRVKIYTKEIFHVISIEEAQLTAIMAGELEDLVKNLLQSDRKSMILDMHLVDDVEAAIAVLLNKLHEFVYGSGRSFVICCINPAVRKSIEMAGVFDSLNITPTDSEAWDIVQMEEIERELGMDS
ncbi:MAG: STAS domain-containing protein [Chitinophagia bacterium]|jgi:anti-anti-sigma factor